MGQILFSGLTIGCIYALVALGFTLTISTAGIINFAYGDWVTYGALFGATFATSLGFPLGAALVLSVLASAGIGFVFQWTVFRPLEGRHYLSVIAATVGLSIAMQSAATIIWGPYPRAIAPFFGYRSFTIGGVVILLHSLLVIVLTIVLITVAHILLRRTPTGVRLQATAQDPETARLMGIRVWKMRTVVYCTSAGLAGIAGFLVAPLSIVTPTMGFSLMLKAFAATILGGWGNLSGAVFGGLFLGVAESLVAGYVSTAYKDAISFGIIIVVLIVAPQGLFRERISQKI